MPAYAADPSAERVAAALGRVPAGSSVSAVATGLLDLFTSGEIAPGTRLPPERKLAESLQVGRSAVREALAALELLGVVDVRPGSGTYLRGGASELLEQSLSWGVLLGDRHADELLEVRGALEIYAARLAADRMPEAEIAALGADLDRMRAAGDDLAAFVRADLAYHQRLASSTGNSVLLDLLRIIRSLLRVWADRAVDSAEEARLALEEHAAVHAAIVARDPDAAASAMSAHMESASRRLAAVVGGRGA
jgi:GntR family transcriptional regulator, transcriptional repressor for pyruvate dehydrogenase complex